MEEEFETTSETEETTEITSTEVTTTEVTTTEVTSTATADEGQSNILGKAKGVLGAATGKNVLGKAKAKIKGAATGKNVLGLAKGALGVARGETDVMGLAKGALGAATDQNKVLDQAKGVLGAGTNSSKIPANFPFAKGEKFKKLSSGIKPLAGIVQGGGLEEVTASGLFVGMAEKTAKYVTAQTKLACEKEFLRSRRTTDPNNPLRLHSLNMHRYRVQTVKPVIDTSSPMVAKNTYSQPTKFNRRLSQFAKIEGENALLLRRIAEIHESKGMVDNHLSPTTKCINNRGRARQVELLKITFGNLALVKRLQEVKSVYSRKQQIDSYNKHEEDMERMSYWPLFFKWRQAKGWEAHEQRAYSYAQEYPTMLVFLQIGTDSECLGRIIVELNYTICPMTCENFRCLCTGELGLSYKCSTIHRIIPDILWQGGDITGNEGLGNRSIYGETFPDENFTLSHDRPGTVSMANCGPDTNGSQFLITARATPALDRTNVVFGRVIGGMGVLKKLLKFIGATRKPKQKLFILNTGVIDDDDDIEAELDNDDEPGYGDEEPENNGDEVEE